MNSLRDTLQLINISVPWCISLNWKAVANDSHIEWIVHKTIVNVSHICHMFNFFTVHVNFSDSPLTLIALSSNWDTLYDLMSKVT